MNNKKEGGYYSQMVCRLRTDFFHDILNRIVVAVEDELVSMLPHKWVEPVTIPLVY